MSAWIWILNKFGKNSQIGEYISTQNIGLQIPLMIIWKCSDQVLFQANQMFATGSSIREGGSSNDYALRRALLTGTDSKLP